MINVVEGVETPQQVGEELTERFGCDVLVTRISSNKWGFLCSTLEATGEVELESNDTPRDIMNSIEEHLEDCVARTSAHNPGIGAQLDAGRTSRQHASSSESMASMMREIRDDARETKALLQETIKTLGAANQRIAQLEEKKDEE